MDERETRAPVLAIAGALAAAGAFLLIGGLLMYSLATALDGNPRGQTESGARPAPTATRAPFVWTGGPYVRPPSALYIFMLCDHETVEEAIYNGIIESDYVTLRPKNDYEVMVALARGEKTIFPSHARIFQSVCSRQQFGSVPLQPS